MQSRTVIHGFAEYTAGGNTLTGDIVVIIDDTVAITEHDTAVERHEHAIHAAEHHAARGYELFVDAAEGQVTRIAYWRG